MRQRMAFFFQSSVRIALSCIYNSSFLRLPITVAPMPLRAAVIMVPTITSPGV